MILFFNIHANSQSGLDSAKIDKETFMLYQSGIWDELTGKCEYAFDNGFDSYHLRMRAGTAYYMERNYLSAINNFERALEYKPGNAAAIEYLYYSYLFSGRESDASSLVPEMPEYLKKKLGMKNIKLFDGAYSESGFASNSGYSERKKNVLKSTSDIYDEYKLNNNLFYYNLTLLNRLSGKIYVVNAFNFIDLNQIRQIKNNINGLKNFDIATNQKEYFFNLTANLNKGFDISASIHYVYVKSDDYDFRYDTTTNPVTPVYTNTRTTFNNIVLLISLSKMINKFKLFFTNSYSNLNDDTQYQNNLSFIYFPLGNLDLYFKTDFIIHSEKEGGQQFISHGIIEPKIGCKINRYLWVEGFRTFGNIYNFNEGNAFIIYNNDDVIRNRFGINFISPVIPAKMELFLYYQYFDQESTIVSYTGTTNFNTKTLINPNHKLIGGVKWIF